MDKKKTIDVDIRDRMEAASREVMADHPELEAIGVMFLSKQLSGVLSGMIVGASGPQLRPDQNVRLFDIWVRIGMQLMLNSQRDVQVLDQMLAQYARRISNAQAEAQGLQPQQAAEPAKDRP